MTLPNPLLLASERETPQEPMPLHKPVRRTIECSCGWKGDPDRYERHRRDREPEDVGRWVADGILSKLREGLSR